MSESFLLFIHREFGGPKPLPPTNHNGSDDTGAGGVFPRNSGGIGSGAAWKVGVLKGWFGWSDLFRIFQTIQRINQIYFGRLVLVWMVWSVERLVWLGWMVVDSLIDWIFFGGVGIAKVTHDGSV